MSKLEEFRDWQAYSFKLEDAVRFQRERVKFLEAENITLATKFKKEKKAVKEALHLNNRLFQALNEKKAKYKKLKLELEFSDQNSQQSIQNTNEDANNDG